MAHRLVSIAFFAVLVVVTAVALLASPQQQPAASSQMPALQQNPPQNTSAISRFMQDYANRHPVGAVVPSPDANNARPLMPNRVPPRVAQSQPHCSIPLKSWPIDPKKKFFIHKIQPKGMDSGIVRTPSAPTCNTAPAR